MKASTVIYKICIFCRVILKMVVCSYLEIRFIFILDLCHHVVSLHYNSRIEEYVRYWKILKLTTSGHRCLCILASILVPVICTCKQNLSNIFFKLTIYYMGYNGSLCLQEELSMEYQYSNLFYTVTQYKGLLRN